VPDGPGLAQTAGPYLAGVGQAVYRLAVLLRCHPDRIRDMNVTDFYGLLKEANGQV
jgi:hypothetical protein